MATIREKRPGYWEVREFVGRDASGRPIQVSRPVRGTKKDALAVAAALRVSPTSPGPHASHPGNPHPTLPTNEW